jgi:hypothetical protein
VNRQVAIEDLLKFSTDIRRNTIRKILLRSRYKKNLQLSTAEHLLERAKRDFIEEIRHLRRFKERLERQVGEPIGPIEDQDGRQI